MHLAAAHCVSRCSTASAAAFSAAVLWHHLVLAMAERDDGGWIWKNSLQTSISFARTNPTCFPA